MLEFLDKLASMERRIDRYLPAPTSPQFDELEADPIASESVYDLIPKLSPTIKGQATARPDHLAPLVDELEAAIAPHDGQRFFFFSVPPRHWKSETLKHAIVKHLHVWTEDEVAYCTHTATFAAAQSRDVRRLARLSGLQFADDSNRKDEWHTVSGSGLIARGVGGELTGRGFRLIIVDDPVKSREIAESTVEREKIFNWIEDDVVSRLTPDGTLILVHTRWHPDDPIGRYKKKGWRGHNIQAIREVDGKEIALLPSQWPLELIQKIRDENPFRFASLYQGDPRPRGGRVFDAAPQYYSPEALPVRFRRAHGLDLAYSKKSRADRSVLLSALTDGWDIYLTGAKIRRERSDEFIVTAKGVYDSNRAPIRWYCGGTEKAIADLFSAGGVPLNALPATQDKFTRSQGAAKLWNRGRVFLPRVGIDEDGTDWVHEFTEEIGAFTGVNDPHDDIVDALAALVDEFDLPDEKKTYEPAEEINFEPESRWHGFE
jgi:hypothetical protein